MQTRGECQENSNRGRQFVCTPCTPCTSLSTALFQGVIKLSPHTHQPLKIKKTKNSVLFLLYKQINLPKQGTENRRQQRFRSNNVVRSTAFPIVLSFARHPLLALCPRTEPMHLVIHHTLNRPSHPWQQTHEMSIQNYSLIAVCMSANSRNLSTFHQPIAPSTLVGLPYPGIKSILMATMYCS